MFTADKTYAEVAQAIANNTLVVVICDDKSGLIKSGLMFQDSEENNSFYAPLTPETYAVDDHVEFIQYTVLMTNDGNVSIKTYALKWAGTEITSGTENA